MKHDEPTAGRLGAFRPTRRQFVTGLASGGAALGLGLARLPATAGTPIAAETDVIERIFEAAKERQKQSGGQGQAGGAMLEMMQEMMGKGKPADKPGQQQGEGAGEQGGEGQTGDSDSANSKNGGTSGTKVEERRVPKASGKAGQGLPREFQDALDAYNRAAEKLAK